METWCLVGVVVPNSAVQKGCREDEQRVVVQLAYTPQKRYGRPSPEQVNSMKQMRSGGSTLPSRVRARDGTGSTTYGRCGVTKREMTEGGVQNIYYAEDRAKRLRRQGVSCYGG
jgi:hypothetical protein